MRVVTICGPSWWYPGQGGTTQCRFSFLQGGWLESIFRKRGALATPGFGEAKGNKPLQGSPSRNTHARVPPQKKRGDPLMWVWLKIGVTRVLVFGSIYQGGILVQPYICLFFYFAQTPVDRLAQAQIVWSIESANAGSEPRVQLAWPSAA